MSFADPPTITVDSKPADRIGFTEFAYKHLIGLTGDGTSGFAIDFKPRVYVLGGRDANGNRIRRELSGTISAVFNVYTGEPHTRLWVKWKDGRRHLVHRKS